MEDARESRNTRDPGGEQTAPSDSAFADELEERLAAIEAPDYDDPARANLTGLDWLSIAAFVAVVSVGFVAWGY